jgi:hypothetical protein
LSPTSGLSFLPGAACSNALHIQSPLHSRQARSAVLASTSYGLRPVLGLCLAHGWGGSCGCGGGERNENSARVWKGCCLYMLGTLLGHTGSYWAAHFSTDHEYSGSRGSAQLPSRVKFDPRPCPVWSPAGKLSSLESGLFGVPPPYNLSIYTNPLICRTPRAFATPASPFCKKAHVDRKDGRARRLLRRRGRLVLRGMKGR